MFYFSSNIKLLRTRRKRTQDEVSNSVGIKRAKYNSYENGIAINPPLNTLSRTGGVVINLGLELLLL